MAEVNLIPSPDHGDLPVACTLSADDGAARTLRWKQLFERATPSVQRTGRVIEIRFRPLHHVREELEALVAAESQCCAFVSWTVSVDGGHPVLRIVAPDDRPDDIEPIASAFGIV